MYIRVEEYRNTTQAVIWKTQHFSVKFEDAFASITIGRLQEQNVDIYIDFVKTTIKISQIGQREIGAYEPEDGSLWVYVRHSADKIIFLRYDGQSIVRYDETDAYETNQLFPHAVGDKLLWIRGSRPNGIWKLDIDTRFTISNDDPQGDAEAQNQRIVARNEFGKNYRKFAEGVYYTLAAAFAFTTYNFWVLNKWGAAAAAGMAQQAYVYGTRKSRTNNNWLYSRHSGSAGKENMPNNKVIVLDSHPFQLWKSHGSGEFSLTLAKLKQRNGFFDKNVGFDRYDFFVNEWYQKFKEEFNGLQNNLRENVTVDKPLRWILDPTSRIGTLSFQETHTVFVASRSLGTINQLQFRRPLQIQSRSTFRAMLSTANEDNIYSVCALGNVNTRRVVLSFVNAYRPNAQAFNIVPRTTVRSKIYIMKSAANRIELSLKLGANSLKVFVHEMQEIEQRNLDNVLTEVLFHVVRNSVYSFDL